MRTQVGNRWTGNPSQPQSVRIYLFSNLIDYFSIWIKWDDSPTIHKSYHSISVSSPFSPLNLTVDSLSPISSNLISPFIPSCSPKTSMQLFLTTLAHRVQNSGYTLVYHSWLFLSEMSSSVELAGKYSPKQMLSANELHSTRISYFTLMSM